ncbi:glycerol kinase [Actinocatenispora thailandica]|uniref:Glycerol kinase n=1 Tax=Actinocatenispora thailandica TaxID=227318 RepID=A0A7R7DPC4_9ACTN|nr:FGGY family carbohydrate kinase [Actinocatenispora thailandica]BCJ35455.1 glycerol kinase [Actinocatenispora thailandica]
MSQPAGRILALDLGSSSVRAVVLAADGDRLTPLPGAAVREQARIHQGADGAAELDLTAYLGATVSCLDELSAAGHLRGVHTVGISTQWHSLLGLDEHDEPVGPCLSWMDLRPSLPAHLAPVDPDAYHARTGAWWHPFYWPVRIGWLRARTGPARRYVGLPEYLGLVLWGEPTASVSSASGTGALDTRTCRWDDEALALAGVTAGQVPQLADDDWRGRFTREYRKRWPDLADAVIAPPLGDGAASALGSGCFDADHLSVTVGTSAAVRLVSTGGADPAPTVWRYRVDHRRAVHGVAYSGGGVLDEWVLGLLDIDPAAQGPALAGLTPGEHGLVCLPFHAGHRPPATDPAGAGGTLYGLRLTTTGTDVLAATLEGLCHEITDGARAVDPAGTAVPMLGGGAVAASSWLTGRLTAALGGRGQRVTDPEVGALGAAAGALGIDLRPATEEVTASDTDVAAMATAADRHRALRSRLA